MLALLILNITNLAKIAKVVIEFIVSNLISLYITHVVSVSMLSLTIYNTFSLRSCVLRSKLENI